jgi:hypothetical protein
MRKVNRMITRKVWLVILIIIAATPAARAQIDCSASGGNINKLACLIPKTVTPSGYIFSNTTATGLSTSFGNSFSFLPSDVGGEISQIPLASPASGIIFTTDPTLHVPVPSDESLGPILTQRADTIGRHKLYIAATYQYFLLQDVDGNSLRSLPYVFSLNSTPTVGSNGPDTTALVNGRIDLKIHQFVGYATFGLSNNIDASIAVPILRVDMRYTVNENYFNSFGGGAHLFQNSQAEQATGIGDIVLAIKDHLWKFEKGGGLTIGAEFRLPTGDALNFLGSGAYGLKPYATFTYAAVISPHVNVGYQVNSASQLVTGNSGYPRIPNRLIYSGGADWRAARRLTFAADVLEQRVFDGPRATISSSFIVPNSNNLLFPGAVTTTYSSYNRTDGSVGLKLKPVGNLLISGNLVVALDRGGLRSKFVPLIGLSYTF